MFRPTIFADAAANSRIACEEIFGPVLTIVKVDSYDEALDVVNDSEYGLTGRSIPAIARISSVRRMSRCRQSVSEPEVDRRDDGRASVCGDQIEWHELQGRRSRLFVEFRRSQGGRRKALAPV